MFDKSTRDAVAEIAARIHVPAAALLAVAEVESGGQSYAIVNGTAEPLIRWEGHYFDQRLKGAERELARSRKLSSPVAGKIKNPANQQARWKIVERAMAINKQAALESFSIGIGQVMTAHWDKLGYANVDEMIQASRKSVGGQVDVMARFIETNGLADELQRLDFNAFARGYNGKNHAKNNYAPKMAAAYRAYSGSPAVSQATGMLRLGSKGERVRALQRLLERAGYAVKVDGDFGPSTKEAVRAFQRSQNVTVDGVAGPETFRQLESYASPTEDPGAMPVTDVPEVKKAVASGAGLTLATQFKDQLTETASYLTGTGVEQAEMWSNYILTGAGVLGAGLALWAIAGWLKSKRTDEGDVEV